MNRRYLRRIIALAATVAMAGTSVGQEVVEHLGLSGLSATSVSTYSGIVAVGTNGNGVYWRPENDVDSAWTHVALGSLNVMTVYVHKSGPIGWAIGAGVARTEPGGPLTYCSQLGGAFEPNGHGILDSLTTQITKMVGFPDPTVCGETFAAGDRVLYKREFADTTWKPVYETTLEGHIESIAARPEIPGVVVAGGTEGFAGHLLIRSVDFGETWKDISPVVPIRSVDFGGSNGDVIFVSGYQRVHRSRDGGATWEAVLDGLGARGFTHVLYDAASTSVFAAARANDGTPELFYSVNDGDSWHEFPIPATDEVADLTFGGGNEWVYFATAENGVFRVRRSDISTDAESDPSTESRLDLYPNFPNPFSHDTTIEYTVAQATDVTVEVIDLLGRIIASWHRSHPAPGTYSISWTPGDLADGFYLYSVKTDRTRMTRTMIRSR